MKIRFTSSLSLPWCLMVGLLGLGIPSEVRAEVASGPLLRIEAGAHTAMIRALAVDEAQRVVATAGEDRTVRLWDAPSGALLRTLRPPQEVGASGRLGAVALSPDGRLVACGGELTAAEDASVILVFSRTTGELLQRLGPVARMATMLRWSPDGKYLLAGLGRGEGVHLWSTADWKLLRSDTDFNRAIYGLAITADGSRAAGVAADGTLRVYSLPELKTLATAQAPAGSVPCGAAFSPDGTRLLVGADPAQALRLYSVPDLKLLREASFPKGTERSIRVTAWGRDGRILGAGTYGNESTLLRSWDDATLQAGQDFAVGDATVSDIVPAAGGRFFLATSNPAWGLLRADGERIFWVPPVTMDFRGQEHSLAVSPDGLRVHFRTGTAPDAATALFDVRDRVLSLGSARPEDCSTPVLATDAVRLEGLYADGLTLNGKPVEALASETFRSGAVLPDGGSFLFGSDTFVARLSTTDGRELWRTPLPNTVWAVGCTADGRVAVAALGDGTLQWLRAEDGAPLLTLFPHTDQRRWVLFTPKGYYDCSAGGEDLLGWQLNNGPDQAADFVPVSRFRVKFYRPDVIDRVLVELAERADSEPAAQKKAKFIDTLLDSMVADVEAQKPTGAANTSTWDSLLLDVDEARPPVVTILAPEEGTEFAGDTVTVRYRVRAAEDAPATEVRALVDGRPVPVDRALGRIRTESVAPPPTSAQLGGYVLTPKPQPEIEMVIPMPPRDAEVTLLAENRHGTSLPATVRLVWAGEEPPPQGPSDQELKPKLYALIVGVSRYDVPELELRYAAKDARDFAESLRAQEGGLYGTVTVKLLTDGEATRDEVMDGLDWLQKETTARDVAALFLAGHGVNDTNGTYFYLPSDANPEKLLRSAVRMSDIRDTLSNIPGKALFFIDTCHAGNVLGTGTRTRSADVNGLANELASAENGAVVFASSTGRQLSQESVEWENGAFTRALVEGLGGKAARDGKVTIALLEYYLAERVKRLTNGRQTPTVTKPQTVPDFPIALVPGD